MPDGPGAPEVWLLGSSDQSAGLPAGLGTVLSFAHFISSEGGAGVTRAYREGFRPSATLAARRTSLAVFVVCADTEAEARRLAFSRDLFLLWLSAGRPGPYPSPRRPPGPGPVLAMGSRYGVDEFVVVTITHDATARVVSYELRADVLALTRRDRPVP